MLHKVKEELDNTEAGLEKLTNGNRSVSTEMISYFGRTYGNSRTDIYVQIPVYVTFEFGTILDMGHQREFWCIYLYIAAFPIS